MRLAGVTLVDVVFGLVLLESLEVWDGLDISENVLFGEWLGRQSHGLFEEDFSLLFSPFEFLEELRLNFFHFEGPLLVFREESETLLILDIEGRVE